MLSDDVENHDYIATKTVTITAGRDVKYNRVNITLGSAITMKQILGYASMYMMR